MESNDKSVGLGQDYVQHSIITNDSCSRIDRYNMTCLLYLIFAIELSSDINSTAIPDIELLRLDQAPVTGMHTSTNHSPANVPFL